MRHRGESAPNPTPGARSGDWHTLSRLFPYLWRYKWRVGFALLFMVGAKLANVAIPLLLKQLVDTMNLQPGDGRAALVVPVGLLLSYGALRLSTSAFTELRELVFAKATQGAARAIALQTFEHLHALSLRFHLARQTGGMTRDIERGVRGIESLISYSLYSIVPTLIEVALVLSILAVKFDAWFAWITVAALALYILFTVRITEWRTQFRRQANEFDSAAHTKAIDSLLNYETVKYFGNEAFEASRYDESLERLRRARLKAQTTLSLLNTGQQLIIAAALVAMLGPTAWALSQRLPPRRWIAVLLAAQHRADGPEAIFWGDVIHHPIQFLYPDLSQGGDADPEIARVTRRELLERCASEGLLLLPAHFPVDEPIVIEFESSGAPSASGLIGLATS